MLHFRPFWRNPSLAAICYWLRLDIMCGAKLFKFEGYVFAVAFVPRFGLRRGISLTIRQSPNTRASTDKMAQQQAPSKKKEWHVCMQPR